MTIPDFIVRVHCLTYNHAAFIEDAMNGFCSQKTTFPYVCTIVDDASTDGEQDVIRRYLASYFNIEKGEVLEEDTDDYHLVYARHNTNANCYFAVFFLKYNHYQLKKSRDSYLKRWNVRVKYIAWCEGDDFWISSDKLQKQVLFLDNHPDHTLCIHAFRKYIYQGQEIEYNDIYKYDHDVEIIPNKDVINGTGLFAATSSMLYRASALKDYPAWARKAPVGDRPLKFVLFARGHLAYINELMSVYRVGVPGSWTVRVGRNRAASKKTRHSFIGLLIDFDEWTQKRYHSMIREAIRDYRIACFRQDLNYLIKLPIRLLKKTVVGVKN